MARKWLIKEGAPYAAFVMVAVSMLHPGKAEREASALRAEFEAVKSDNAKLRQDFVSVIEFLRGYDPSLGGGGGSDVPADAGASDIAADCPGGAFMVARGKPGFRVGSDWWVVGDLSPWGLVEQAFRGGFVAEGRRYKFSTGHEGKRL